MAQIDESSIIRGLRFVFDCRRPLLNLTSFSQSMWNSASQNDSVNSWTNPREG